MRYTSKL